MLSSNELDTTRPRDRCLAAREGPASKGRGTPTAREVEEGPVSARRKVTLTDVAARAGVSTTTASYILNGRGAQMRISADAERRVMKAVEALGYRPNRNALNLRTATTRTIGVITDHVASGAFASAMLAGAGEAARDLGHYLLIGETEGDPGLERQLVEEMIDRQVDGLLYATLVASEITVPSSLRDQRVVLLNCHDPESVLPSVLPDEFEGGRTGARVLLDAGIRQGVFVVGHDPTPKAIAGPLRQQGIEAAFAERGAGVAGLIACDWEVPAAYAAVNSRLNSTDPPAALICLNDRIAMGAYQALAAHRLSVPGDVSVVSFDGSDLATWLRPEVTSVALPFKALGAAAVRRLLRPQPGDPQVSRLEMPLAAGGSVAQPVPAR